MRNRIIPLLESKGHYVLVGLMAGVIAAGIVYSHLLGNNLRFPDEHDYYRLANNLVTQHSYTFDGIRPTAIRPPAYPMFLAIFVSVGADIVFLRILNFIALAGCTVLMFVLLQSRANRVAGVIGAIGVLCYPVLFYTAGTLYPQIIGAFLFLSILVLMADAQRLKWFGVGLAGLLAGFLILMIPSFVFSLALLVLYMAFVKRKARAVVMLLGLAALPIALWTARNYSVFNTFVLISTNSGYNLLLGNSENTSPNSGGTADLSQYWETAMRLGLSELDTDKYFRTQAIQYMLENKPQVVQLYVSKVLNYFNYRNELYVKSEESSSNDLIMLLTYGPLLLLVVLRLIAFRRFPLSGFEWLLILIYLADAFSSAIFTTRIRYRLPFDLLLMVIAASFMARRLSRASDLTKTILSADTAHESIKATIY